MVTSGLDTCQVRPEPGFSTAKHGRSPLTQEDELATFFIPSILSTASGEERAARPLGVQPGPGEQHPGPAGAARLPADGSPRRPQRGREQNQADGGLEQPEPQQPGGESGRPSPGGPVLPCSEGVLPQPCQCLTLRLCV